MNCSLGRRAFPYNDMTRENNLIGERQQNVFHKFVNSAFSEFFKSFNCSTSSDLKNMYNVISL